MRAFERRQLRGFPRFTGTVLLLAFFGAVGLYGTVRGGQYEDFVALQGDPRDLVANALGFGIEEVTHLRHRATSTRARSCRSPASIRRGSLPFFDAAAARERLLTCR